MTPARFHAAFEAREEAELVPVELRYLGIVSLDGRLEVAPPQPELQHLLAEPFFHTCTVQPRRDHRLRRLAGTEDELYEIALPIPGPATSCQGTLVAGFELSRWHAATRRRGLIALGLVLFFALGCGLLVWTYVSGTLLGPLSRLANAVMAMAEGRLPGRVPVEGSGQIARVARAVNGMARRLELHTQELESEVRSRTEQLTLLAQRLADEARTDMLTGARNRRHMEELLRLEIAQARRSARLLSFVMIDVDHFKDYNDTHGHPAGDEVLRQLVELLGKRLRMTDQIARFGGEEFVCLLLDTSKSAALLVAEKLRAAVEEHPFPHRQVTISLGVASFPEDADDLASLVQASDEAMYRAKSGGRNRVEAA